MRRIHLIGVAVAAVLLAVAVAAYAVPASESTFKVSASAKPKKAGTKKKPKALVVTLGMKGDTTPPGGSPSTSTDIAIQLPGTQKWFGSKWPKAKRCDGDAATAAKSDSGCPKGSRISLKPSLGPPTSSTVRNHVTATAQPDPTKAKIIEEIDLTAYVLKNGGLGFWLEASSPAPIAVMLPSEVTKKNTKITVHIPTNVQEPVPGIATGIEVLNVRIDGKIKSKGKTFGAISSIGCKRKKWKTTVTNIYRDGKKSDFDTAKCTAPKKK